MEITNAALFCEKCSLQFDKKIVYDIHMSFVHKISIEVKLEENTIEIKEDNAGLVLQCEITKSKQNIGNSIQKGNKSYKCKKPYKCSICSYSFSQQRSLKRHIESVHDGKKPHKCSICDYSFSSKGILRNHIKSIHPNT